MCRLAPTRWIKQQSSLHQGEDAAHLMQKHGEIADSLQAFSEADDLKRVALEVIACPTPLYTGPRPDPNPNSDPNSDPNQVIAFSTPPGKLEELRSMFVKMDTDDSGTLSIDEFKSAMALHPEIPMAQARCLPPLSFAPHLCGPFMTAREPDGTDPHPSPPRRSRRCSTTWTSRTRARSTTPSSSPPPTHRPGSLVTRLYARSALPGNTMAATACFAHG